MIFFSTSQTTGAIATYNANFGQGTGPVSMSGVHCIGTESRLWNCTYTSYSSTYHGDDAGVRCAGKSAIIDENTYTYSANALYK